MVTAFLLEITSALSYCVLTNKSAVKVSQTCLIPILCIVSDPFVTHLTKCAILFSERSDVLVEGIPILRSSGVITMMLVTMALKRAESLKAMREGEPPVDPSSGDVPLQSADGFCV